MDISTRFAYRWCISTKDKQQTPLQLLFPPLVSAPREIPFWLLRRQFSCAFIIFWKYALYLLTTERSMFRQLTPKKWISVSWQESLNPLGKYEKCNSSFSRSPLPSSTQFCKRWNELSGHKLPNWFFSEGKVIQTLITQTCIQARFLTKDWYKWWEVIYYILCIKTSAKGHVRNHVRCTKNKS